MSTGSIPAPRHASAPATTGRPRAFGYRLPAYLCGALLVALSIAGMPYFVLAAGERIRHPMHAWLKPSGYLGQSAGILALALFVFLWLYPLRKRFAALAFTGAVARWLDVHTAAGLLMPLAAGAHAGWRFRGVIGLGFAATLVVAASGVVGRYLYTRIPRHRDGVALSREEAAAQLRAYVAQIATLTGLDPDLVEHVLAPPQNAERPRNPWRRALAELKARIMLRDAAHELIRWATTSAGEEHPLDRRTAREVARLVRRDLALAQQLRVLDRTQRLFRYWHVAHRPIAITALLSVLIHVGVVVALGATWFW